jgi:PhzF family phenazine biosynthesis protein
MRESLRGMIMRNIGFQQVDAFTDRAFSGNPAAVCILDEPIPEASMQTIAREMNLSETAFILPLDNEGVRHLRWFTPTTEVPLCGHATLAAGHVLRESGADMPLRFRTRSGELVLHSDPAGGIRMDFPSDAPEAVTPPVDLAAALDSEEPLEVLRGQKSWVVRLSSEAAVRETSPDFRRLRSLDLGPLALVMSVTALSDEDGVDFASRVFAPWAGIDEDPVTGVAHTTLAPYWCQLLGRTRLQARQVSERGGEVTVRWEGDRVHLIGHAVQVAEGTMRLP